MANKRKKVLFVIVEGESDGYLFFDELEKVYPKDLVIIKAFRGDIFTNPEEQGKGIRDRIRDFFISKKIKVPYRLFYLSQELEHVIFDELNVPQKVKEKKMVTFLKQGLSMFREILEGQLRPFNATIERGYTYKKKLSFIHQNY